jgi:putative peptidoglycan lipid II flippase
MKRDSIVKATLVVSILVIVCKLLGFAREAIIAAYYGANGNTDAFFFAQGMPASIFPSICNSISTAFTALYVNYKIKSEKEGIRYASTMLFVTSAIGIVLSLIGVGAARWIVPVFAPGFSGDQLTLAIHLTKLVMGAFFLTMLQYMLSAILNSNKIFFASQVANIVNNLVIIIITVWVGKSENMDILTLSVIFGLLINVFILIICSRRYISLHGIRINAKAETIELIKLSAPIILGNSVVQINTIVDKALGSLLEEGSLSALTYAGTLNALVTGVFITSLSTVLYPSLAEYAANKDEVGFAESTIKSAGLLSILLTFISFICVADSRTIVGVIFERGSFDTYAAEVTATVLSVYAFLYVFAGIREVLTRSFFAVKDTKTPMINSAIGVGFNILFSIIFVKLIGIKGIALGTVLSNIIISALLMRSANKKFGGMNFRIFGISLLKQFSAGLLMMILLFALHRLIIIESQIIRLLVDGAIGFTVYSLLLVILRCDDFMALFELIRKRITKRQDDR